MFNKIIQFTCSGILFLGFNACYSSNKTNARAISPAEDSLVSANVNVVIPAGVPQCIVQMIATFRNQPKENPPRKIFQYNYRGNKVYYITAPCCDQYTDLLDSNCKLIGHPDGGFTGKGDGRLPDFNAEKKEEKLVWEDKR